MYPPPQSTPQFLKRYTKNVYNRVQNTGAPLSPQFSDGSVEDTSLNLQVRRPNFDDFLSFVEENREKSFHKNERKRKIIACKNKSFHSTNHEIFLLKI